MSDHSLVVDLDGTLILNDTLPEQLLWALPAKPWETFVVVWYLVTARKAQAKARLAEMVAPTFPVQLLPVRKVLVDRLRIARESGVRTLLATATHRRIADRIAAHLGVFDEVIATDSVNMKGDNKRRAIEERLGAQPFTYFGDSHADVPVWRHAAGIVMVNPTRQLIREFRDRSFEVVEDRVPIWKSAVRILRPRHWVKNSLVFVPIAAAHNLTEWATLGSVGLAAAAFSLLASAVYCINDLMDVQADRQHRSKRTRPLASGSMSVVEAAVLGAMCGLAGLLLGMLSGVLPVLLLYVAMNIAYTWSFKRKAVLDVIVLAGMYACRIAAGSLAADVTLSGWLIAFSLLVFLGLAIVKRCTELREMPEAAWMPGRGYAASDVMIMQSLGVSVSVSAVVVLALYVRSAEVTTLYARPEALWLFVPLLLYWIARVWLLAGRGRMHDDPIVFATRDRITWLLAGLSILLFFVAQPK